jgi:hypothetical protein
MTDEPPDYMGMNGAEFRRAVGTDPEKWAEAFIQSALWLQSFRGIVQAAGGPAGNQQAVVAGWFRDAMEAAVKHAVAPRWDQQYSDADLEAAAKQAGPEWDKLNKAGRPNSI